MNSGPGAMENPGYCTGSLDSLYRPSDDDDDEMVDIAGATLDFSSTEDVPPLSSGTHRSQNLYRTPHGPRTVRLYYEV